MSVNLKRIHHVAYRCKDAKETVDFYKRVFGATADEPFVRGGANWVFVHIDTLQVTVSPTEAMEGLSVSSGALPTVLPSIVQS